MTAVTRRREEVPESLAGERLDRLVAMVTGVSRAEATALVADGAVRVDGTARSRGSERLAVGAVVEVELPVAADRRVGPESDVPIEVVHVDDDVIVIDKPPGLVVHPGAGVEHATLVQGLLARFPELAGVGDPERPGIVHRLDKGTSGLLVVARSAAAHADLVAQLSSRSVERRYRALVWGWPDAPQGLIDAPVGRSQRTPTRMTVSARGREARTHYSVERTFDRPVEVTLLRLRLETGRTHQIRVHLDAIGHPVVGDDRYGGDRPNLSCPRPFLHADSLAFTHPATGQLLQFVSPLPPDLQHVLAQLHPAGDGHGGVAGG